MKNNFHKTALFPAIIFFIFSCFIFLFIFAEISEKDRMSEQALAGWHTEASRREEIKSLNRSMEMIEEERASLQAHFAQSADVVLFLDAIEGLAPKAGVKAEVLSVDTVDKEAGLRMNMKASGSFEEIYKFLTLLENAPYELEFISIDMQKKIGQTSGKKPLWEAIFKIKLLSFIK